MARREVMQAVELVEHDVAADEPAADGPPSRRRLSRRRLLVPAAVVVALVGTQLVVATRERAAVAALAEVPGVVRPVDADLRVLWTPEPQSSVLGSGIVVDGKLVGLDTAADGAQSLVAVDEQTGARTWATPLSDAHTIDRGTDGFSPVGGCLAEPGTAGRAACLVTDGYLTYRDTAIVYVPDTASRLVVVDVADGSILADRPAPSAVAAVLLPSTAVTAVPQEDGAVVVTATDLVSGSPAWQTVVPPSPSVPDDSGFSDGSTSMFATADGVGVVLRGRRLTLLDTQGRVVRSDLDADMGYSADPGRASVAVFSMDEAGRQRTTVVGDGPDLELTGGMVQLSADDGSVPDLVLVADTTVRAYDRSTGDARWSIRHVIAGDALVLRGRVYVSTGGGVVAVDGRTGKELWRAPVGPGLTLGGLVTDGRHLLSSQQRPEEPGDVTSPDDWPGVGVLVAYRFDDGGEDWRIDLPDGLFGVGAVRHTLVGWGSTSAVLG
ncbi:outer membrane protein assembly factor BamB family protein [Cellulomonas sp. P5_E12]